MYLMLKVPKDALFESFLMTKSFNPLSLWRITCWDFPRKLTTITISRCMFWICFSYVRITVSDKNTHLPVFKLCVFRVYLRNHFTYKKVISIYLHPCLKSFHLKKEFLKSGHKISWYFQKRCFARKK